MSHPIRSALRTIFSEISVPVPGALDRQQRVPGFNQQALSDASILCIGAGGLMSNIAPSLVRKGIGKIILVDPDSVEPSNLNRQYFWSSDVGESKALAMAKHLVKACTDVTHVVGIAQSIQELADARRGQPMPGAVAVCAVDNNPARVFVSRHFQQTRRPVIFTAVSANADHGYVFIQKPSGPCIACLFPDIADDESYPCPGTPAVSEILQAVGALVLYAIDVCLMARSCDWNYRAVHLSSGDWDCARLIRQRSDCRLHDNQGL